ncbi:MAG TPA: hypothetical protein VKR32_14435 [Puia sp.]|nr:hypothetical protein [Puia sp.]
MENSYEIWFELEALSPLIAGIKKVNPYKSPDYFFDQLPGVIMSRLKAASGDEASLQLEGLAKDLPFSAPPAGYFDGFADKLMQRLRSNNSESVDEELASLSPLLTTISRKVPFSVPDGYFEELPLTAVEGIRAVEYVSEKTSEASPWLEALRTKETYSVPEGYFEGFCGQVFSALNIEPQKARVVPMNWKRQLIRVAAAAVVVGVISTATLFIINKKPQPAKVNDPIAALSKLSDDEMINYLQNQDLPIADSAIDNPVAALDLTPGNGDARDLFSNISDEELNQYINEDISFKEEQVN